MAYLSISKTIEDLKETINKLETIKQSLEEIQRERNLSDDDEE